MCSILSGVFCFQSVLKLCTCYILKVRIVGFC